MATTEMNMLEKMPLPSILNKCPVKWDEGGTEITSMSIEGVDWKQNASVTVNTDKAPRISKGRSGTISGFAEYSIKSFIQVKFGTPDTGTWFSPEELILNQN